MKKSLFFQNFSIKYIFPPTFKNAKYNNFVSVFMSIDLQGTCESRELKSDTKLLYLLFFMAAGKKYILLRHFEKKLFFQEKAFFRRPEAA